MFYEGQFVVLYSVDRMQGRWTGEENGEKYVRKEEILIIQTFACKIAFMSLEREQLLF